jgi:hypothetical protein
MNAIIGAVYDRALFLESTKYARSFISVYSRVNGGSPELNSRPGSPKKPGRE